MSENLSQQSLFKTSQLEEADADPRNPSDNPTMGEIISRRFSRRGFAWIARCLGHCGNRKSARPVECG